MRSWRELAFHALARLVVCLLLWLSDFVVIVVEQPTILLKAMPYARAIHNAKRTIAVESCHDHPPIFGTGAQHSSILSLLAALPSEP